MAKKIDYGKLTVTFIALAILARFGLALLSSVSGDACWHLSAARFIANERDIPLFESIGRDEPFWAPPLFHLITAGFYVLFGDQGLKLVSPLFGSASLIIGYLITRRFLGKRATFYAMLFFSFLPLLLDYSVLGYGESVLLFFVLLSLYFAFEGRFAWSGIVAGLAILSKYNGGFIIPVLLYLAWAASKGRERWKNLALVCVIPAIIASPWLMRNFLALGNPIWPFLNFLFPAVVEKAYSGFDLFGMFSLKTLAALYLGFFGVPDGNLASLSFVSVPFFQGLFAFFIIGTLLFLAPLVWGFQNKKENFPLYILLASFLALFLLYVANVGPFVSRMLIPALIALAIFYGRGAERLISQVSKAQKRKKSNNGEAIVLSLMIIIALGFLAVVGAKFFIASQAWGTYQEDFDWVKENTPKEAVFLAGGQCIQFHIERTSVFQDHIKEKDYQYVWVNQNFDLDKRSILTKEQQETLDAVPLEEVYRSQKSGTAVYKVIR